MTKPKTIPKLLDYRVNKNPKAKALGWINNNFVTTMTAQDKLDIVKKLSTSFRSIGVLKSIKVSILSQTRKEWHLLDLGILSAGGIVVPIYPSYPPNEIEFIFNHSESSIIIVEDEVQLQKVIKVQNKLSNLKNIISIETISKKTLKRLNQEIEYTSYIDFLALFAGREELQNYHNMINEIAPEDIATIIYTSGTTNEPKGAVISHQAFISMLNNLAAGLAGNVTNEDKTLTFLPLSHVLGRCDSMLNLVFGLVCIYAESMDKIIDNLSIVKPTIMLAVPRIFEKIYTKIHFQLEESDAVTKSVFKWASAITDQYYEKISNDIAPSTFEIIQKNLAYKLVFSKIYNRFGGKIRFFVSGGASLSAKIITFLRNANLTVLEGYGLTETIAPCFVNPPARPIPGTVGVPLGDVQIKFAKDREILIKTEALFSGYFKDKEQSDEVIDAEGWFATGDLGELTAEGYLKITDRKKDIIITSNGKNIAPQKIENLMKIQPYISRFMVAGDDQEYLTGIVSIEKELFVGFLEKMSLNSDCTVKDIARHPLTRELIQKNVDEVNQQLASFETIKKFIIAQNEFSIESGELTPSLKLKKKLIRKMLKKEINAMYKK